MYAHLNEDTNEYECRDLNCIGNNVPSWSGYCHECPKDFEPSYKLDRDEKPIMIPDPEDPEKQIKEKDYFCKRKEVKEEADKPAAKTGGKWVAQWIPDDGPAGDVIDMDVTEDQ